ncbi:pantetheine-phosphate adenylyltransferase family protein [Arthroderma uncinatum]|uniref:pantetheine-phosphate adenylyltransferase family protein n=1 Tax=Arthroderma uncinatum TaxID=74035 RepID=UPI00144A5CB6|nr:pantetheine-phosphate adenylyltransferase family protein [Arthroderma uncinatum]KAF3480894.1 pantetheine-phosphate adenylyltransferase family protein [Arthroderma uncinatum]
MASLHHEALLLLTNTPASFSALKTVHGSTLKTVVSELAAAIKDGTAEDGHDIKDGQSAVAVLDVAVVVRGLNPAGEKPFARLQQFLASFYKLLGAVSVSVSAELDGPGGIDARVFFLDVESQIPHPYGPIIDVKSFLASNRSWDTVYASADGSASRLAAMLNGSMATDIRKLPGPGGDEQPEGLLLDYDASQLAVPHYSVAVGGTFDHLHAGHKLLLTATVLALDTCSPQPARSCGRVVTIGITGDELLVNKKYAEFLESWEERWKGVWTFLQSTMNFSAAREADIKREFEPGPNGRRVIVSLYPDLELRFVQIADPFGPTITDKDITALVVSKETRSGGKAVNDEREKKGWSKLDVFEVDVLDAGDGTSVSEDSFESKISSTEIRRRRMNLAKGSL